jgi:hypothetical protein
MEENIIKETAALRGHFSANHIRNGEQIGKIDIPNTIMNVGKSVVSSMIGSDITTGVAWDYIGIGTSGISAVATQEILGSERLRENTTTSQQTTSTADDTARFIGSFAISGTHAIQEAGIFNVATQETGSMLARTTFTALNVISGDAINATWDVIVG